MIGLGVAALIIVLNGFFVAAEFALVKVRATQLHSRARRGDRKAIAAQAVVSRLDRYLSVTQIGVTIASLVLGWVGEPAISHLVEGAVIRLTGEELGRGAHVAVTAGSLTVLTFGHVLIGELLPKLVAIQRSETVSMFVATPLRVLYYGFAPLLWVLERCTNVLLPLVGMSADSANEGTLSEEEILGILAANTARSPAGQAKAELLERVVRFANRTARHAMVPRVDVVSLPIDTNAEETIAFLRTHQFSRILLTHGRSLDEVAGYLYDKELLLDPEARTLPNLRGLRRDLPFMPESASLVDVLREMQQTHTHIAVVVDEYGGTSGMVTMEDLLEEIVGEINDEFDEAQKRVVRAPGEAGAWDVDARAAMEELRSIDVLVEEAEAGEPVGSLVVARLGRIPRRGDRVTIGNASVEVTSVAKRRVQRVRVRLIPPEE